MSCIETVTRQPEITAENVLRLFPEVNTTLIGGSHHSATSDNALQGYDEEQIRLMDEVCIVLDNNDVPIGSATKKLCMWEPVWRNAWRQCACTFTPDKTDTNRPLDGEH
jgi:isopentenyl-diphosphate delta-isomerase